MLPHLHIRGFRAFDRLDIDDLGQLNLLVGENGIGKSSVLEALSVYAAGLRGFDAVCQILAAREEVFGPGLRMHSADVEPVAIERVFHAGGHAFSIDAGEASGPFGFVLGEVVRTSEPDGTSRESFVAAPVAGAEDVMARVRAVRIKVGERKGAVAPLQGSRSPRLDRVEMHLPAWFIAAEPHASDFLADQWDRIALTAKEAEVIEILGLLFDDVERVGFVQHVDGGGAAMRVPMVKRLGRAEPEPLQSLGAGARRLLSIAMGMVGQQGGLVLVDEVESGIHHAALRDVWDRVGLAAQRRGTQVFATTHSWDCVVSFQQAMADTGVEARLIRLRRRRDGGTEAIVIGKEQLATVAREGLEVR